MDCPIGVEKPLLWEVFRVSRSTVISSRCLAVEVIYEACNLAKILLIESHRVVDFDGNKLSGVPCKAGYSRM